MFNIELELYRKCMIFEAKGIDSHNNDFVSFFLTPSCCCGIINICMFFFKKSRSCKAKEDSLSDCNEYEMLLFIIKDLAKLRDEYTFI